MAPSNATRHHGLAIPVRSKQHLKFKRNQHTGLSAYPGIIHMFQNALSICNKQTSDAKDRTSSITVMIRKSTTMCCPNHSVTIQDRCGCFIIINCKSELPLKFGSEEGRMEGCGKGKS